MIKFSNEFQGWFGKIAEDFTYENIYKIGTQLSKYYKENSTSGQKLIIGYDSRIFSKKFAEFLSALMAENGVKVFFGNKISPTSALVASSIHKKSMGAISITADSFSYEFLGVKAYDADGFLITEEELSNYTYKSTKKVSDNSFKKFLSKGFIEPFDPSICYTQYVEKTVSFENCLSLNKILFNPNFGSGINYFDDFLNDKGFHGYTVNYNKKYDISNIEINSEKNISQLYEDMIYHGAELGFSVSPDCSTFEFLLEPHSLTTKEIVCLLLEYFNEKKLSGSIILSQELNFKVPENLLKENKLEYVSNSVFLNKLKENDHLIAVDNLNRFYFKNSGVSDALLAGFCLIEIFNNKNLTPKLLQQKLNKIKIDAR